jgi:hypothetical protein
VFDVPMEKSAFVTSFLAGNLSDFVHSTDALPGVHHTQPMTLQLYPVVGSVRLVCLEDGETAEERVLEQDEDHLRYLVTNYTSKQTAPIEYGIGEFTFSANGNATSIAWSYSFKLRDNVFPGSWGALGRTLFRLKFLNADYADFMDKQKETIRAWAARQELSYASPRVERSSSFEE